LSESAFHAYPSPGYLIGSLSILLWGSLALLTRLTAGVFPPLLAMTFALAFGLMLAKWLRAGQSPLGFLRQPPLAWALGWAAVRLSLLLFSGHAAGPGGAGELAGLSVAAADSAVFRLAARPSPVALACCWAACWRWVAAGCCWVAGRAVLPASICPAI
jgi:hypothetical protein